MGNPAQARLDAANDNWHIFVGLPQPLTVNRHGSVGALARRIPGGVRVVVTPFLVRGVVIDHGVHVAGGHTKEQIRPAQSLERLSRAPVRLRNHADPKTLRLQHAADDGHAKAGVINVAVTRYNDDVAAIPAQLRHLGL